MADLKTATEHIIENERNAGHPWATVWAALHFTHEAGSVNGGWTRLRDMRGDGVPRWLVQRWARIAGLTDISQTPTSKHP